MAKLGQFMSKPMFASWLDGYRIADCEDLNARVLASVEKLRGENTGMRASNIEGWHSHRDFFESEDPAFRELANYIRAGLTAVARRFASAYDPARHKSHYEGWINVNSPGAFNAPHDHILHHLAGCYYVSTPGGEGEASGAIEFVNPLPLHPRGALGHAMYARRIRYAPNAGDMLIFPAMLTHWVRPNHSDRDRVSIAFNFSVLEEKLD